jgi:hypothetical protein
MFLYKSLAWPTGRNIFNITSYEFSIIHYRAFIDRSIKYSQQSAQIFTYTALYLKHYASKMFRFLMDHLQGVTASISYVYRRTKVELGPHSKTLCEV